MRYFVQIVCMETKSAVRFPFVTEIGAKAFEQQMNDAFKTAWAVDAVVGCYQEGERCPYGFGAKG